MNQYSENPWEEPYREFLLRTMPFLNLFGKKIGELSGRECPVSKEIIKNYAMLHRSFDPMTYSLLKESIEAWKKIYVAEKEIE